MKPSPSFALPPGTIVHGKEYDYIIKHYIANGTFGITYLAEVAVRKSSQLPFLVAIKEFFMHETNGRYGTSVTTANKNGEFAAYRRKFIREAKNLKRMNHPNIIKVIECFDANNTTYYSMEYLESGDLDHYIKQHGPLSELTAFRFAKQISLALQYMHSKHMLHFDLKPQNVMLRNDGSAVLIDFGLSKELDSTGAPESSTNIGKGTPGYAPIEQADYKPGNGFPATIDIYALGATMYKMLTKQTPPTASDALNNGLSLNLLKGRVEADTIEFIAKAMASRKDERYQSMGEVLDIVEHKLKTIDNPGIFPDDLTPLETSVPSRSKPVSTVPKRPKPLIEQEWSKKQKTPITEHIKDRLNTSSFVFSNVAAFFRKWRSRNKLAEYILEIFPLILFLLIVILFSWLSGNNLAFLHRKNLFYFISSMCSLFLIEKFLRDMKSIRKTHGIAFWIVLFVILASIAFFGVAVFFFDKVWAGIGFSTSVFSLFLLLISYYSNKK